MAKRPTAYERIDAKLRELAARLPEAPAWRQAVERLTASTSRKQRLAAYQAVRNAGSLPEDAAFYLVASMLEDAASGPARAKLRKIERQLDDIERRYGLREDEYFAEGEAPAEYEAARKLEREIRDEASRENFRAHGEQEIADLFTRDRSAYYAKFETGRLFFFGTAFSTPDELEAWVDELMAAVSRCINTETPIGPLACRYLTDDDIVDMLIYATPVEIVGGADDGEIVDPDFDLDLVRFHDLFTSIVDFGFSALGSEDECGPHIWLEGEFRGQPVYLHVLSRPPEDEEPGMKFDMIRKRRR